MSEMFMVHSSQGDSNTAPEVLMLVCGIVIQTSFSFSITGASTDGVSREGQVVTRKLGGAGTGDNECRRLNLQLVNMQSRSHSKDERRFKDAR
jgi:hypothetical protein